LIRWAYTVKVVVTSRCPINAAMSMGRMRTVDGFLPAPVSRLVHVWMYSRVILFGG
jgi:hypothetical protein